MIEAFEKRLEGLGFRPVETRSGRYMLHLPEERSLWSVDLLERPDGFSVAYKFIYLEAALEYRGDFDVNGNPTNNDAERILEMLSEGAFYRCSANSAAAQLRKPAIQQDLPSF